MATKKPVQKKAKTRMKASSVSEGASTKPKFPYATKPNSLRKFLELIPQKPKPNKVNAATLKAWDLRDTNDSTIIRVLKALGLVGGNNEPTPRYTEFMTPGIGPAVLAGAIKQVWSPLFEHSHEPHKEDDATLRNYFNIHSGGGEKTIGYQIQTFKAACDHADFSDAVSTAGVKAGASPANPAIPTVGGSPAAAGAVIHIDLHIHLPENKSRRDYEYIFEDIAKYIFGREVRGESSD